MSRSFMKKKYSVLILLIVAFSPALLFAQAGKDTTNAQLTLQQCIDFALRNQPAVRQAAIDEEINERDIRISLAAWLPQINSNNSFQHYFKTPPIIPPALTASPTNSSNLNLTATQVIYNNDVFLASRASKFSREYYKQNTQNTQIELVSDVSKDFFDVLLSTKQLDIIREDIVRLQRSLKDAYARYQAGVVDKTDYKQATISLNNELATRKQTEEAVKSKIALLKQAMGFTPARQLNLVYDSTRYESAAVIDTNQTVDPNNRIEYQELQTQRSLQTLNVDYYRFGFLPTLSAFGQYNLAYANNSISGLYGTSYPNSFAGLTLSIPIFTGTRRLQNLSKARLQVERRDLDIENLKNVINTQYTDAMAGYKSNYSAWNLQRQNVSLAKDVYTVVSLQYREGIKTYLDVIVAQADLRTAELNYYNALFQLLSSKIDLQKALGTLVIK